MYGITQATLTKFVRANPALAFPDDVALLTLAQAREIYRRDYWRFDKFDSQKVATKVFDMAVNMGPKAAVRLLQKALNTMGCALEEDGCLGGWTALAVNAADPDALVHGLIAQSCAYYRVIAEREPSQEEFLRGWLARATEVPNA